MTLLYSETLYAIYQNYGLVIQLFYTILFVWALIRIQAFKGAWWWFFTFITVSFIFEVAVYYTPIGEMENNQFINHVYSFVGAISIGLFLYKVFNKKLLKQISLLVTGLLCLAIVGGVFFDEGYLMPSKVGPVSYLAFLILHLFLHRQLTSDSQVSSLRRNPLYWWNIAFIILHVVYLLFSATIGFILPVSDDLSFIWYIIKNTFDPICCVLWIIAINKLYDQRAKPVASL